MNSIIENIITTAYNSKEGHIASSLSVINILYMLYAEVAKLDSVDKDVVILSKGHASLGLYAVLDYFGKLPVPLTDFCKFDGILGGHPTNKIPNIEASTGSLGHGLPFSVGIAHAYKIKEFSRRVYTIIGDGEFAEGSNWEAMLLATHHNLDNITCILDYNKSNIRSLKIDNILERVSSFGWHGIEIDGHNNKEILTSLTLENIGKPIFIIANTIKGKGISRMENNPEWHHKVPNDIEYREIIKELQHGINI